ncbi:MAG: cbb3-type cytochrome c oxidase subunit I [candidate division NC10 bacterium]|nr:cbb3-type cytochrome c oxidase subunit I [candidate division NC10 bacterium]
MTRDPEVVANERPVGPVRVRAENPFTGPSLWLPLRYLITGQVSLLLAIALAVLRAEDLVDFYYQGHLLAITHLITLGWITTTIMGASFLVAPLIFSAPLYSERLGRWQFPPLVAGIAVMVVHFWTGQYRGLATGAALVLVATVLFLVNLSFTLRRIPRKDVAMPYLVAALAYLAATVVLGTLMALDKVLDFLGGQVIATVKGHAHLAALGWVSMMILGVGHKMIPLLSASTAAEERRSRRRCWILNAGIVGLFLALVTRSRWVFPLALVVVLGFGSALWRLTRPWREGKRPRPDWSTRHVLAAFGCLALAILFGLALASGLLGDDALASRVAVAYAFLGLAGWISLMIMGMSYRVVPLLVWLHRYSPIVHDEPVPKVSELCAERWQPWSFLLLVPGVILTAGGLILPSVASLRAGLLLLGGGVLVFEANMLRVYGHVRRPVVAAATAEQSRETIAPGRTAQ